MSDVTQILSEIEQGRCEAADQLLVLVYDELRQLAASKLSHEAPGQTLQATALVHEAYLRLFEGNHSPQWKCRRHFFAAAAEAMRRILIDRARAKRCQKRGGLARREPLTAENLLYLGPPEWVLSLDEAITKLSVEDVAAGELVRLRFFAGLSVDEAAQVLEISRSSGYRLWTYARAWLLAELCEDPDDSVSEMAEPSARSPASERADGVTVDARAALP